MACLLKLPDASSRGVITVTTQERDNIIRADAAVADELRALKDRWAVGLHHNWHDHAFRYDDLYDFSMAGADDLVEVDGRAIPLVELDACNFVPSCFEQGGGDRFWDVLFVARAVAFKGMPTFLETMRELYDRGIGLRAMCIAPMPSHGGEGVIDDLVAQYERRFSDAEQERFNLLPLTHRYPFPFDLPTLAHFYRSSRCFAHFAEDERRCRVAAYAWAAGIPVVGTPPVGSLLPAGLRVAPQFHEVADYTPSAFADAIVAALADERPFEPAVRSAVSASATRQALRDRITALLPDTRMNDAGAVLALDGLDLRLGRHHGISTGANRVPMTLHALLRVLSTGVPADTMAAPDPELALAAGASAQAAPARRRLFSRRGR